MDRVDCIVVGAGVVGLAVARACARAGMDTLVLEAEAAIGAGVSSRNSEVIHAGIYYPPGSLKARLCVEGRRRLYDWCAERGVAHRRCGKLLVATDAAQLARLDALRARSLANGLAGPDEALRPLSPDQARELEPQLACVAALWSPSTGIVDSHGLMLSLLADAEAAGAALVLSTRFVSARPAPGGFEVRTESGGEAFALGCRRLVLAAGLHSQASALAVDGLPAAGVPPARWVKGNYFALSGVAPPFSRLVYPMPTELGLGVHATVDLAGQVRFGPDTEPVERLDYTVDPARAAEFERSVRDYWPALPTGALRPDYAGIRPKIDAPEADFAIHGVEAHGLPGLVALHGIESPGLTAALAIADVAVARLDSRPHARPEAPAAGGRAPTIRPA